MLAIKNLTLGKIAFLASVLLLAISHGTDTFAAEEHQPTLLIYINPVEFSHEVHIGYAPYFSAWIHRGPMLEKSAKKMLQPHFSTAAMCEGNNTADVILWLKPRLSYNPIGRYSAKVVAQFHLGSGKHLGNLTATGIYEGQMDDFRVNDQVQHAYDNAMQEIARQYATNSTLHEAIQSGLAHDFTKAPCAIVAIIPTP